MAFSPVLPYVDEVNRSYFASNTAIPANCKPQGKISISAQNVNIGCQNEALKLDFPLFDKN